MNASLILQEKDEIVKEHGFYECHGKCYFDINMFEPVVSGYYEVLISPDSKYRDLIKLNLFVPILYYEYQTNTWRMNSYSYHEKDIGIIGWRSEEKMKLTVNP